MASQTDLFRLKCITNGVSAYSSIPRPTSRNNVKGYLMNIGQNTYFNIGRIQSDETLPYVYVNGDKKLDVLRCIIPANGLVGLDNKQRPLAIYYDYDKKKTMTSGKTLSQAMKELYTKYRHTLA
jgi:hypothetical protein